VIEFLDEDEVEEELRNLLVYMLGPDNELSPLLRAVLVLFGTLIIHPLSDGNGRLARILFQATLRRHLGLQIPILPLGPVIARNRSRVVRSYLAWELDGDALPLVRFVIDAVEVLLRTSEEVMELKQKSI